MSEYHINLSLSTSEFARKLYCLLWAGKSGLHPLNQSRTPLPILNQQYQQISYKLQPYIYKYTHTHEIRWYVCMCVFVKCILFRAIPFQLFYNIPTTNKPQIPFPFLLEAWAFEVSAFSTLIER